MSIEFNTNQIQNDIAMLLAQWHRPVDSVTLMAASKQQDPTSIRRAYQCGIHHFGENYLQEALTKMPVLADLPIVWHMIGAVQSNKAREIAKHFSWVHTIARSKVIPLLARNRPAMLAPLNVCIEINIDNESSKSGANFDEIFSLAAEIAAYPQLKLRGLMCVPAPRKDVTEQIAVFRQVAGHFAKLKQVHASMDTLSMGMTSDYASAIATGATIIRVGTGIFGARSRK